MATENTHLHHLKISHVYEQMEIKGTVSYKEFWFDKIVDNPHQFH